MIEIEKSHKVVNGKLLHVRLNIQEPQNNHPATIVRAQLTGDFFIHPEEGVLRIEEVIQNLPTSISIESLTNKVDFVRRNHHLQLIGFTPFDVASLVREALDEYA